MSYDIWIERADGLITWAEWSDAVEMIDSLRMFTGVARWPVGKGELSESYFPPDGSAEMKVPLTDNGELSWFPVFEWHGGRVSVNIGSDAEKVLTAAGQLCKRFHARMPDDHGLEFTDYESWLQAQGFS